MSDHSKLKVAELKEALDKKGVAYGKSDKKQTLVDLLDGATPAAVVATAGFEPATTLPSTADEAAATSDQATVASDTKPATASDALANGSNRDAPLLPPAESTAAPTATRMTSGTSGDAQSSSSITAAADVPASTLTATSSRSVEDLTETVVDEVPAGVEQSADGDDEKRGGDDVLGTDEEEIVLGSLPPASVDAAIKEVDVEAGAPVSAAAEGADGKGEVAVMNDAATSVPVVAAPAPAAATVPTPPPPTPAAKRSLSPAADDVDAEMASSLEAPAAKRAKLDEPTYPEPANFVAGSHPPTTALYITGLRRPLPAAALINLLEGFGELDVEAGIGKGAGDPDSTTEKEGWWLSPVKSHAFAAFSTPEAARKAYESLLGRTDFPPEAPQPTPALDVAFLPATEIPRLIAQEEAAWSNGRKKLELKIAFDEEQRTFTFKYDGAGNVDLRRNAAPRAPLGGGGPGASFANFGGAVRSGFAPRGGFQTGGSRGGFGGPPPPVAPSGRGGGFGGRGGFMDRGLAPHLTGGYSNGRSTPPERRDLLAGDPSFAPSRASAATKTSSATWGDRGRPAPFPADRDGDDERWSSRPTVGRGRDPRDADRWGSGGGRGGYGSGGGGDSLRPRDTYRPDDRRNLENSSYRPDDRAVAGDREAGGWGARGGRDSRRSPSPPPRRYRSPSPDRRRGGGGAGGWRSQSPSRDRNGGW